jgi:hypothetical protein
LLALSLGFFPGCVPSAAPSLAYAEASPPPRIQPAPVAAACPPRPACDAPPPPLAAPRPFRHKRSHLVTALGPAQHRGRDQFLAQGAPQWVLAKFAYGTTDKDLSDEDIDVYLLRDCGASWEKIGTYPTTPREDHHPPVAGVEDKGGQLFLELSQVTRPLRIGRHRVRLVVAGDLTATDLFLEVLPYGARVVVTDIDGTLTSSETAMVHHLFYLTARPDWLVPRTRAWLSLQGYPPGILHTTVMPAGAVGAGAAAFKAEELAALKAATGIVPEIAFGNMQSDVATYAAAGIPASQCYYIGLDGDLAGGVRHDDYRALVPSFAALPPVCR